MASIYYLVDSYAKQGGISPKWTPSSYNETLSTKQHNFPWSISEIAKGSNVHTSKLFIVCGQVSHQFN